MPEKKIDEEWKRSVAEDKSEPMDTCGADDTLPEAAFAGFIHGLASQVLINLGEIANPISGKTERSLPQAKYTIDLLQILKEKTAGNLTEPESRLLDSLLYDLRMRYVQACS